MKVLSFIQFYGLTFDDMLNYLNELDGTDYKIEDYDGVLSSTHEIGFCNEYYYRMKQPFKPQLITEKFKPITNYAFRTIGSQGDCIVTLRDKYDKRDLRDWFNVTTLDRFICHCQDAGIELSWRTK